MYLLVHLFVSILSFTVGPNAEKAVCHSLQRGDVSTVLKVFREAAGCCIGN